MSDEIILADFEKERRPNLWLSVEVWTDIFKHLSRRELVQRIQPADSRFKKICDENVGSIHVIRNANKLIDGLANQRPEAIQHFEALKSSKCELAKQFRLSSFEINISNYLTKETNPAKLKRRWLYQQCVMRHSIDLFRGCQVHLYLPGQKLVSPAHSREYLAYLNLLNPIEPTYIELASLGRIPALEMEELFKEPTILNCKRLTMLQAAKNEPGSKAIFDWLHHFRAEENEENLENKSDEEEKMQNVRCLNIPNTSIVNSIEEVLDRCIQNLNQCLGPLSRRPFVLSFWSKQILAEFCIENQKSGEVLVLENVKAEGALQTTYYRLRRCLASELGGMEEFYGKMFRAFGKFKIDEEPTKMRTFVEIS